MRPGFQRLAARIPGLRWIARRRARRVFDLCAGFVYSQILLACVELGLLEALAKGPAPLEPLARAMALSPPRARRLLQAAISLELVEPRGRGRYGLGPLGAALVGNPAVQAMIRHHALLYADLADPIALLRDSSERRGMAGFWPYATAQDPAALPPESVAGYSALMAASQSLIADQVLDAFRVDRFRSLLDVGGGEGAFVRAVARRSSRPELALFDLPAVAERARERLADVGLADRVRISGGDFLADPLPRGHDLVTLVRVLHDHDDEAARRILSAVRAALEVGGTLLVAEPMADTPGARTVGDAYFAFYLLAMGSGRARTPGELEQLLGEAGFGRCELLRTNLPLQTGLLKAVAV